MIALETNFVWLSRGQAARRLVAITMVMVCAVLLRHVEPANAPAWLPLSCGAVTGLPCIFCGTTRALHCLLNGDFARAFYFNWIAFPASALALLAVAVSAAELVARRRFVRFRPVRVTSRAVAMCLGVLVMLWVSQVTLAVSQQKTELLNPRGPLYRLLVR